MTEIQSFKIPDIGERCFPRARFTRSCRRDVQGWQIQTALTLVQQSQTLNPETLDTCGSCLPSPLHQTLLQRGARRGPRSQLQ